MKILELCIGGAWDGHDEGELLDGQAHRSVEGVQQYR